MIATMDVPLNRLAEREVERRPHSRPSAVTRASRRTVISWVPVRSAMPAATLLRNCTYTELRCLEVIEDGDEVILAGVVRSYYLKQVAQETVRPTLAGRRLFNRVVVLPATADETLAAAPLRVVIATGNADWSGGCAERLQALGRVVEHIGSGLDLLAALRSRLPDVLVVADPLPWGGADGVITRIGELGLLRRVKVIHAGRPDSLARLPVEIRDQLAALIVGDDCTADLVARAVERVLTN